MKKGLKETRWLLGTEQRANAARDTVRGGKGRTGALRGNNEGHEEPLAWAEMGMGGTEESCVTSKACQGVPALALTQGRKQRGHGCPRNKSGCQSYSQ